MKRDFLTAIEHRRTYYNIDKNTDVSFQQIEEIVKTAMLYTPSAFNSQTARILLLFGKNHDRLWQIVMDILRQKIPADRFSSAEEKITTSFAAGIGTVLYFEDMAIVENLQKDFPSYKDNFPTWSNHSSGMLQFVIWTALEDIGLGASLQHYNPIIDEAVKKEWDVTENWKLIAQMPFGAPTAEPGEKEFMPIEKRLFVHK